MHACCVCSLHNMSAKRGSQTLPRQADHSRVISYKACSSACVFSISLESCYLAGVPVNNACPYPSKLHDFGLKVLPDEIA